VATPSTTVVISAQVSGQSWGQAPRTARGMDSGETGAKIVGIWRAGR